MARARIHQHVNPLARYFRELKIEPLDPEKVFADSARPLHIDIGCGRGRFLYKMSSENPDWNFLGVEIREPLVEDANKLAKDIENLHYSFCNAPLDLGTLLEKFPEKPVSLVTIQFPDPWFKKRHAKRRMVNPQLVGLIRDSIAPDGIVFVQTDVLELDEEMENVFWDCGFTARALDQNPMPLKTEREISVENRDLPVYRKEYRLADIE